MVRVRDFIASINLLRFDTTIAHTVRGTFSYCDSTICFIGVEPAIENSGGLESPPKSAGAVPGRRLPAVTRVTDVPTVKRCVDGGLS